MFDLMEAGNAIPALFADEKIQDCFTQLVGLYKSAAALERPARWVERKYSNESRLAVDELDRYYLDNQNVLPEIKGKYQDLANALERAKSNIAEQEGIIASHESELENSEDAYALAVIQNDNAAIQTIEQGNAESIRQMKLSEIRIKANQTAIEKTSQYVFVLNRVIGSLERLDRIRAHKRAEDNFKPILQTFANEYRAYIKTRRDIGHGHGGGEGGFDESDIARGLLDTLGYDLKRLMDNRY